MTTDAAGNTFVAGRFRGTNDFDPGAGVVSLSSSGFEDGYVVKYAPDRQVLWATQIVSSPLMMGNQVASPRIATDGTGNVYLAGYFRNWATFGTTTLASSGGWDAFIAKMDPGGNFLWARGFGGPDLEFRFDAAWGLVVDGAGYVTVSGDYVGTVDFDPGAGVFNLTSAGGTDGYALRLDGNGEFTWARSLGGEGEDYGRRLAQDSAGNVYVTGGFSGVVDFDPGPGTLNLDGGQGSAFIWKLDTAGGFVWARTMSSADGRGITLDGGDGIFVTGGFAGTATFGSVALTSVGAGDVFAAKLTTAGDFVWAKGFGGPDGELSGLDVLVGGGRVHVPIQASGSSFMDVDPGHGTFFLNQVDDDSAVVTLDTAGNFVSARQATGREQQNIHGIALAPGGDVIAVGRMNGDFPNGIVNYFDVGTGQVALTGIGRFSDAYVWRIDNPGLGAIAGRLVDDLNANGTWDAGEPALAGRTVFLDANGNGQPDPGELTAETDARGQYVFPFLAAGNYAVRQVLPAGWSQTAPAGSHTVSLAAGQFATGRDFLSTTAPVTLRVAGTAVNDGSAQRSRVTSLRVTFNAQVTFAGGPAAAFTLTRIGGGAAVSFTATASVVGGVTVVTLSNFTGAATQFGSLADGRFTLTVLASQVSAGGQPLDGNGDGVAGDDYVLVGSVANGLYRLFGDIDGDGTVNGSDFGPFRDAFGTSVGQPAYVEWLDLDGDGFINAFDFAQFRTRFGSSVP